MNKLSNLRLGIFTITVAATLVLMTAATAFAQDLPKIAVYVTGNVGDDEKKALGTRMLASLINSGRYKGIERTNSFLAEIEKEQVKQRSGAIDDEQISELGKQFGVEFVCVADITPAFGAFQVSARIINVKTAEVDFIGDASSKLRSMEELKQVSAEVVGKMFGKGTPATPRKTGMSAGAGALFAGDFGGGVGFGSGERLSTPYSGGGAYIFFDAVYAEAFAGFFMGGGKWASDWAETGELPKNAERACLNVGAFGKYPVDLGKITAFPLLGLEYEAAVSAKLTLANGKVYNGGRYAPGALSALWVKFGGGSDVRLGETLFLRGELLYGIRMANGFENEEAKYGENGKPLAGHGLTFRAGAGVKF